jgi:hypothetical protein
LRRPRTYPDVLPWLLAPESELLSRSADPAKLADDMLRAREGIAAHQLDLGRAEIGLITQRAALLHTRVATATAEVELVPKRVELAGEAVSAAEALVKQLTRWQELSVWAIRSLVVGTVFAILVVIKLLQLVSDAKIDGWELAIALFELALFVISPPVLLIRERPLQGLDQ